MKEIMMRWKPESQQSKHKKNIWLMFKVHKKDTRKTRLQDEAFGENS